MGRVLRPALWVVVGVAIFSLGACNKGTQAISPDEQAIRDLDVKAASLINNKDVNGIAALYTVNGGVYAPGSPPAIGNEALIATYTTLTQIPGFQLDVHTNTVTIAISKDMAIDVGTYTLKTGDVNAPKVENGKYVTTWLKSDGQWKMYTDMFSSDTAPPPEPAAESMAAPAPSVAPVAPAGTELLAQPGSTSPQATGAATPTAPMNGAPPAQTAPSPASGQTPAPAPIQQFGPASPMQNAAPLTSSGTAMNPAPSPTTPASSPTTPPPAPPH
jgi:ketosteroid isomerase-like protein